MTVMLELKPEVEARLQDAAARRGQTVAALLESIAAVLPEDPVLLAFLLAPEDDEPFTEEDRAAVDATREEMARARGISTEELRARLSARELYGTDKT